MAQPMQDDARKNGDTTAEERAWFERFGPAEIAVLACLLKRLRRRLLSGSQRFRVSQQWHEANQQIDDERSRHELCLNRCAKWV